MSYTVQAAGTTQAYPPSITKTGTVTSSGITVTGTGTLFTTELYTNGSIRATLKYLWLYSSANGETRRIVNVMSDTILQIESAFTGALAGETFKVITDNQMYDNISLNPLGSASKLATAGNAAALMDGNTTKNIDKAADFPIVVTAIGANVEILN